MPEKLDATHLLNALLDVLNQSCQVNVMSQKFYWSHHCLSAYEDAFNLLERYGYLKRITRGKNRGAYLVLKWK